MTSMERCPKCGRVYEAGTRHSCRLRLSDEVPRLARALQRYTGMDSDPGRIIWDRAALIARHFDEDLGA